MNNNDTSILTAETIKPILDEATAIVANFQEEEHETISEMYLLLQAVELVKDNGGEDGEGFECELRITFRGYELAIPQNITVEQAIADLLHGLEVAEEILWAGSESDGASDFIL